MWSRPRRKIEDFSFHLIFNDKTYSYTLEELKTKFEPVEIPVTIQCAGNRRSEYNQQVKEKKVNVSSALNFILIYGKSSILTGQKSLKSYLGFNMGSMCNLNIPMEGSFAS